MDENKVSYRETLQGLVQRTRNAERLAEYQAEMQCPPLPPAMNYLWSVFLRLANRRSSNGFGANPIPWTEIEAFSRLTRTRLTPWEVEIVEMLDNLYRIEQSRTGTEHPSHG